jgi:hypothetical protein
MLESSAVSLQGIIDSKQRKAITRRFLAARRGFDQMETHVEIV